MSHVTKKANHVFQMDTSNFEIVCTKSFREVIQKKCQHISRVYDGQTAILQTINAL